MKKILTAAIAAVSLAACAVNVMTPPQTHYAYKNYPIQTLNVGSIRVVEAYRSPMQMPNVEHLMPDPLPHAVAEFARTRFRAGGGSGTLTITVNKASVVTQNLETHKGLTGLFNVDQAQRFEGNVNLEFAVDGVGTATGTRGGSADVNATRGITLAENAAIAERDETLNTLGENILTDLDAGAQQMFQRRLPFLTQGVTSGGPGYNNSTSKDAGFAAPGVPSGNAVSSGDLSAVQPESRSSGYN